MTFLKKILLIIIFYPIVFGCSDNKNGSEFNSQNSVESEHEKYLRQYAGGYTVEVNGVSSSNEVEAYALNENGDAKWMYLINDGNGGATIQSEKNGTWSATEDDIIITIEGNSGQIVENYKITNEKFVETTNTDRYLKPNK